MTNTSYFEDEMGILFDEHGERVHDPMEGVLAEITDPKIVLNTITSCKSYTMTVEMKLLFLGWRLTTKFPPWTRLLIMDNARKGSQGSMNAYIIITVAQISI